MVKLVPKTRKGLILTAIVALVAISLLGFTLWVTSINKATIEIVPDRIVNRKTGSEILDGKTIRFKHSSSYGVRQSDVSSQEIEAYYLTADTNYEKHLAVSVVKLGPGALLGETSYTSRKLRTDLYSERDLTINGAIVIRYVKNDNTEQTAYVVNGNNLAVFSFTSNSQYDDVQAESIALLSSLTWKS